MSLIRKHVAVLQAWACLDLVILVFTVFIIVDITVVCRPVSWRLSRIWLVVVGALPLAVWISASVR